MKAAKDSTVKAQNETEFDGNSNIIRSYVTPLFYPNMCKRSKYAFISKDVFISKNAINIDIK